MVCELANIFRARLLSQMGQPLAIDIALRNILLLADQAVVIALGDFLRLPVQKRHMMKLRGHLYHDCAVDGFAQAARQCQHAMVRPDDCVARAHHFQHGVTKFSRSAGRERHDWHIAADIDQRVDMQRRDRFVQDAEEISVDRFGVHDSASIAALFIDRQMHWGFVRWLALARYNIACQVHDDDISGLQLVVWEVVRRDENEPAVGVTQAQVALCQRHQV